jgi:hypothetical protein
VAVIGVGGARSAEVNALATAQQCPFDDDLRKLLVDRPASCVLLATLINVAIDDLHSAMRQGSLVLTLDPFAADLTDLTTSTPKSGLPGRLECIPAFTRSAGWRKAAHPTEVLTAARTIAHVSHGRRDDCSLFARLVDAWRLIVGVAGVPMTIDASLTGPLAAPPDDLRGLTGHIAAHARISDACSVSLSVSDHAGLNMRSVDIVGDHGHLRVTDGSYHLYDTEGRLTDHAETAAPADDFAALIADDWRLLMGQPGARANGEARAATQIEARALGCANACLLSMRTGAPESPGRLIELQV